MKRKIERIQQKKLKNKLFSNSIKAKFSLVLALSACLSIPSFASDNLPVPNTINGATLNYLDKTGAGITAGSYLDKANAAKELNINIVNGIADLKYDTYNIGKNNIVNYNFTSASQVALNRVTGADPSKIFGTLNSHLNGQLGKGGTIYLINPNGILFGATSKVNVQALVASTLNTRHPENITSMVNELKLDNNPAGIYMEKGSSFTIQDNLIFVSSAIKDAGSSIKAADANVHFVTADGVLFEFSNSNEITNVSVGIPIAAAADITVDGNDIGKTGTIDINTNYMKVNNLNIISKLDYTGVNNLVGAVNLSYIKNVGNDFTVDASGNITVDGPVTVGNNIDLDAKGNINTSDLKATAGNAELTSTGGSITADGNIYAKSENKNVSLNADDNITVSGNISAGNDVIIKGDDIAVRYVKSGKDVNVEGSSFTTKQQKGNTSHIYHSIKAADNLGISTGSGKIELGYVNAGKDINLKGGMISTGILKAGSDITAKGDSFTTKQERNNKSDLYHLLKAENKVNIAMGNGSIDIGNISADNDITLSGGAISTRELNSDTNIDITGSSLSTKQVKSNNSSLYHAIKSDGNITINIKDSVTKEPGVIDIGYLSADNDISLTGGSISTRPITAGNNITVKGSSFTTKKDGSSVYNPLRAGNNADISVGNGMVNIGNISVDNDIKLNGGSISTRELNADRDIEVWATSFSAEKELSNGKKVSQAVKGGGSVSINIKDQLSGEINVGFVRAGDGINIGTKADVNTGKLKTTGGNIDVSGKSIKSDDVISAGDINLNGTGNITLGHVVGDKVAVGSKSIFDIYSVDNIKIKSVSAKSNIDLLADQSVTTGDLNSATGYINIERGTISTGNIESGLWVNLSSTGNVNTGNINAADNIRIISGGDINTADINSGKNVVLAAIGGINAGNILAQKGILLDAVSGGVNTGHLTANQEDITVYASKYIHTLDLNTPKNAVFAIPRFVDLTKNISWGPNGKIPYIMLLDGTIDSRHYADMLDNAIKNQPGLTKGIIDGQIQFTSRYFIPLAGAAELEEEDLFIDVEDQIEDNTTN